MAASRSGRAWTRTAGLVALGLCAWAWSSVESQEPEAGQSAASVRPPRGGHALRARRSPLVRNILIYDGRAMQGFSGSAGGASAYAEALNAIHRAAGERATVYSIIVPTAQEFYLPEHARGSVTHERPNILGTYARLSPGIRTVDAHAELAAHTDENLYFRTDHHPTALGAYYTYRAFCSAAGHEPLPLERMDRRVIHRAWLGSFHRDTRDPELRPDQLEVLVPPAQAQVRVRGRDGAERVAPLVREGAGGYVAFLGGDHPIMRVRTSAASGRRAILVKNSYGNAFAVYLVSHYDELVFVDYRTFQSSLIELIDESRTPTDLLVLNGVLATNSTLNSRMILRLLRGRR